MVSESTIGKCPYEVGDVMTTRNAADPATRWPGTSWQRITDRFIFGAGGSYGVGTTGGEASHVLTVDEMPAHLHRGMYWGPGSSNQFGVNYSGTGMWRFEYTNASSEANFYTGYTGGSAAHNNMPPYLALYIWERIA